MATSGHVQGESLWRTSFGRAGRSASASFLFVSVSCAVQSETWLELAPGTAFLTTERQKLPFQGRSFGTEWWTTDVDTGKKKHVLPRHVGFNNVPLIKSENWTRFLRFVARNRTKAPVFLLVCPRMSILFYFEWYLLLAFV